MFFGFSEGGWLQCIPPSRLGRIVKRALKPSDIFRAHRVRIRDVLLANRLANPCLFGSVLHGTDTPESDLNVLVDLSPGTAFFNFSKATNTLERELGLRLHLTVASRLHGPTRRAILAEAEPL